jgi:acyl-coenzyme A thioesterase PaaI-like protein
VIDSAETLAARIGIDGDWRDGVLERMRLVPYPEIIHNGVVRISVLALVADMMGGFVADQHSHHDWVFTTDLSVRAPLLQVPPIILATGRAQRVGKGTIATEVHMHDDEGTLVAYSHTGFVRVGRRYGDDPKPDFEGAAERWAENRPARITSPLDVAAGLQIIDAAQGIVEVELRDELRNPAGAMQGAMVALVGEVAAETLAAHHLGAPQVVTDLDVRYLAMGRIGPVHSRAWFIGEPDHGTIHVELRDCGNGDRLTDGATARTARAVELILPGLTEPQAQGRTRRPHVGSRGRSPSHAGSQRL